MSLLKCPNPSCPYTFDASTVPPGSVIGCPRCGMRFTLGPPPPPPKSGRHYAGQPVPPGMPQPGAPAPGGMAYGPPPGMPPVPPQSMSASNSSLIPPKPAADGASTSKGRAIARKPSSAVGPKQSYQMIIIVGIAVILLVGAGLTIYSKLTAPPKKPDGGSYVKGMNLAFDVPPTPWVQDEDMRAQLGGGIYLVFKRTDPEAYIAFGGQDYADREPRNSELEQGMTKVVQKILEMEGIEKEFPEGRWLGKKAARAYQFRGQDRKTGENTQGEAYAVADRGVGYWTVGWVTETKIEELKPQFEAIRSVFRFADPKKVWQPKKSTIVELKGDKIAYSLQDPDDIWKEDRTQPAADEDPLADVKRVASIKGRKGSDFKYDANLLTCAILAVGEPMDDAKGYLEKMLNKDAAIFGKTELTALDDEPEGTPSPNVVTKNAEVVRLRARNGNLSKLIVLGAIKVEDKVVFVRCICPWSDREVFEQNFIATCGSLRPGR